MKTISTWSLVGYVSGIFFSIFSGVRYYIIYPDIDKAIVYVLVGGIICCLAWTYNKLLNLSNTLIAVEDYLSLKNEIKQKEEK